MVYYANFVERAFCVSLSSPKSTTHGKAYGSEFCGYHITHGGIIYNICDHLYIIESLNTIHKDPTLGTKGIFSVFRVHKQIKNVIHRMQT